MRKEKSCGAIVFRQVGEKYAVLLIKNHSGAHWSFPKGHVEGSETEYETAVREVKEETALDIVPLEGFREESYYMISHYIQKQVVFFAAITTCEEVIPQPEEISAYKWVMEDEYLNETTYPNDKRIFGKALQFVKSRN